MRELGLWFKDQRRNCCKNTCFFFVFIKRGHLAIGPITQLLTWHPLFALSEGVCDLPEWCDQILPRWTTPKDWSWDVHVYCQKVWQVRIMVKRASALVTQPKKKTTATRPSQSYLPSPLSKAITSPPDISDVGGVAKGTDTPQLQNKNLEGKCVCSLSEKMSWVIQKHPNKSFKKKTWDKSILDLPPHPGLWISASEEILLGRLVDASRARPAESTSLQRS